jgi:hypothetical protein
MELIKKSLIYSFLAALAFFTLGILANASLDYARVRNVESFIQESSLRAEAYLLQQELYSMQSNYSCDLLVEQIKSIQQKNDEVSRGLSFFKKQRFFINDDYESLRNRQMQSGIRLFSSIDYVEQNCNSSISIILFFFKQEDEDSISQSFILQNLKREGFIVIGFDLDSSEPAVTRFASMKNISSPSLYVAGKSVPLLASRTEIIGLLQQNI